MTRHAVGETSIPILALEVLSHHEARAAPTEGVQDHVVLVAACPDDTLQQRQRALLKLRLSRWNSCSGRPRPFGSGVLRCNCGVNHCLAWDGD